MATIISSFTEKQLSRIAREYITSRPAAGLTDFNEGSADAILIDAFCNIAAVIMGDMVTGTRIAIRTAYFNAYGFSKLPATSATGFFRFYRLPAITVSYDSSGTSCVLTISDTTLTTTVTGGPGGEDLSIDFATYDTFQDVVDQINANAAYTAVLIGLSNSAASSLYNYASKEIIGETNHLDNDGMAIMAGDAAAVTILSGLIIERDDGTQYQTIASGSIASGAASSGDIASEAIIAGLDGDMAAGEIDTINGSGVLRTAANGVEYVKNDSSFSGGTDQESESARLDRFRDNIRGLAGATKFGIRAAVRGIPGVRSASVMPNYPIPGYNTIIADDGTGVLSEALETEILKVVDGVLTDLANYPGVGAEGIHYQISVPNVVPIVIVIEYDYTSALIEQSEIETNMQTAIENYINTRGVGDDIVLAEIIKIAKSSHSGIYDLRIPTPGVNISIALNEVPRIGAGVAGSSLTMIPTLLPGVP